MKKLSLMKKNEYAMNEVFIKNYNHVGKKINEFLKSYAEERLEQLDIWSVELGIQSDIDGMTSHDMNKLDYIASDLIEMIETENYDY